MAYLKLGITNTHVAPVRMPWKVASAKKGNGRVIQTELSRHRQHSAVVCSGNGAAPAVLPPEFPSQNLGSATESVDLDDTAFSPLEGLPLWYTAKIGTYHYSEEQKQLLRGLTAAMQHCAHAFFAAAVANIGLSVWQVHLSAAGGSLMGKLLYAGGNIAGGLDGLVMGALFWWASKSFTEVLRSQQHQLHHTFVGLNRLGVTFHQSAVALSAGGIIEFIEAAARWPSTAALTGILFSSWAVARSAALWYVMWKFKKGSSEYKVAKDHIKSGDYPTLSAVDRCAFNLVSGSIVQMLKPTPHSRDKSPHSYPPSADEYSFNRHESGIVGHCEEALVAAAVAAVWGAAGCAMFGISSCLAGLWGIGVAKCWVAFKRLLFVPLMLAAAHSFDRIRVSKGHCIHNLLEGLGPQGLTGFFKRLSVLVWALTAARYITTFLPIITQHPLGGALPLLTTKIALLVVEALSHVMDFIAA